MSVVNGAERVAAMTAIAIGLIAVSPLSLGRALREYASFVGEDTPDLVQASNGAVIN
jgi:hypothetical protein